MQAVPNLNDTAQTPEQHAISCWAALERHVKAGNLYKHDLGAGPRCGCYLHSIGRHIEINKNCEVGGALAEEYETASRRVREIQAAQSTLEPGDFEAVPS